MLPPTPYVKEIYVRHGSRGVFHEVIPLDEAIHMDVVQRAKRRRLQSDADPISQAIITDDTSGLTGAQGAEDADLAAALQAQMEAE